jgi:hypothetical protein
MVILPIIIIMVMVGGENLCDVVRKGIQRSKPYIHTHNLMSPSDPPSTQLRNVSHDIMLVKKEASARFLSRYRTAPVYKITMMLSSLSIFATVLLSLSCGSHAFVLVRPSVKTTFSTITTLLEMHNKRAKKKPNRSMKPKGGFAGALRDLQTATFDYAGTVKPGKTSPQKIVLQDGISIPDYAQDGMVRTYICSVFCVCIITQSAFNSLSIFIV